MPKKAKVGKQRRDKAYWSAKEIGFRSRASFKLIQLNRKFEFLQRSRACLDLCAAPGSWMQVAKENMPVSSLIIGVDLCPIKPIHGCIALQGDITTDKCRADIRKNLQSWKVDVVLHDGAPNVGQNWIHDAYQQSLLTLHAFKLATEFLQRGGTFVTKIFRSKDYQSLIWVLKNFFKTVNSTKPAASRHESAEIFVVCLGYKAPDKIDPKFIDARHVFAEVDETSVLSDDSKKPDDTALSNPSLAKRKKPAEGYECDAVYKAMLASDFVSNDKPLHVLNNFSAIQIDVDWIKNHPATTTEIVECCSDLRILNIKDLRLVKQWRESLHRHSLESKSVATKNNDQADDDDPCAVQEIDDPVDAEESEWQQLDTALKSAVDEERRDDKRKRKKLSKEEKRREGRLKLDTTHSVGDDLAIPVREEHGLFDIQSIKSSGQLKIVCSGERSLDVTASDEEDGKKIGLRSNKVVKYDRGERPDYSDGESVGDSDENVDSGEVEQDHSPPPPSSDNEPEKDSNPLIVVDPAKEKRQTKADLWFSRQSLQTLENEADENIENDLIHRVDPDQGVREEDDENDDDSCDSEAEGTVVVKGKKKTKKNKSADQPALKASIKLSDTERQLAQEMLLGSSRRRDILDAAWNRRMFAEDPADLPKWFNDDECKFDNRGNEAATYVSDRIKQLAPETKAINDRTIKKVAEAKARRKRKVIKRLQSAKRKTSAILDNPDVGSREKLAEIKKAYKKAASADDKRREVSYVVSKKREKSDNGGYKSNRRPAGVKGLYKRVDSRMKKDRRAAKRLSKKKNNKKRK